MKKTVKYTVSTEAELLALKKIFTWSEIFDMCRFKGSLLTKALALSTMDQTQRRDKKISEQGFKIFFQENELLSQN